MRGKAITSLVTVALQRDPDYQLGMIIKREKTGDDIESHMRVVETAFEWVSAQRVVNF